MPDNRIAIYIRLSDADRDTGRRKDESNSVVNQRGLIHHFLDNHPELSDYPRTEFVDDGFTGTNTNRPAFQRMIKAIREGKYCCCITKDFSRFVRDYIEMGDYLECLFPFLGIRYISINDGYDSNDYLGTTGGLDVVLRAIIYDTYSKDLSVKVKTAKAQGMKKGRRVGGVPPYGFKRDPNKKGVDIIDPEAAVIVRKIFDAALTGMSVGEIVEMLNREHIMTPAAYFRKKYPETRRYARTTDDETWIHIMVVKILRRYAYTGAAVGGTIETMGPGQKVVPKKRDEWFIVPGMHEAIITPEEYEQAQKVIAKKFFSPATSSTYPLKSLVVCGTCLRRMRRYERGKTFFCEYGSRGGKKDCRLTKSPNEERLEQIVFQGIQDCMKLVEQGQENRKKQMRIARDSNMDLETLKRRISSLKQRKFQEYDRYNSGKSSKAEYLERKEMIDAEIARFEAEIARLRQDSIGEVEADVIHSEVEAVCDAFRQEETLTYDMAHAFVDRILVYPDERIEVQWRFNDCFTSMN